ncbi:ExbD/TolR family protein [Piscinibacter terrae]|uniref:Biopolymer transporter ExbD n=1 Tax=Piscinibacter terrae TaxID=2496871 RepID=A0A3N7HWF0_9BURK|nr:biopolymer transporter ExbD [Albitalea terrae]RQP25341.1 biopolymer transporter ExbD [Albitalea terrae]
MRVRRLRKHAAHLEITAFINLIVVLVPFLLSTAVFTRLAVIDLSLPAQSSGGVEQLKENDLKLEVVLRPDAIEVGDRIGGLIQRIPNTAKGYDLATLSLTMYQIKAKFPDKLEATLLAQPNTPYDTLVQVMDTMRMTKTWNGSKATVTDLFPAISIGDAPIAKK